MNTIKIVTDSTADIPKDVLDALDIHVVPLKVHFGDETFYDGVDIQAADFFDKLVKADKLPTTSQPSPTEFVDMYQQISREHPGCSIISIHLAAALSGTYQSAMLASTMLEDGIEVEVVDSRKVSYATGMVVKAAAELALRGVDKKACMAAIQRMIEHMEIYFLLDTLDYLNKGGRIGKASALAGSLLNIKPILSFTESGEVFPVEKIRGSKKARARLLALLKKKINDEPVDVAVVHSNEQMARDTLEEIRATFNVHSDIVADIGPVIGTHGGPNSLGVVMLKHEYYPA